MEEIFSDSPILIAQTGPLSGQRWGIRKELFIGRDPECEIMIPDRQVSRIHAKITYSKTGVSLEDLSSKNGTFLNGTLTDKVVFLQEGDIFQIALVQSFYFLSSDATMPLDHDLNSKLEPNTDSPIRLHLDFRSRRVWMGDQEILPPLSVPQFRLLNALNDQAGKVVSRSDLVSIIWGDEKAIGVSEQALDALVRRLRERLNYYDPSHEYLVTVRGHGIRLDNNLE
ncbi:MAG TPA: FHA domain-containing protein [Anaerolineaceae bacterium]|nr:FHA domain-containing protein [Anaerolineaceae bacterium]